MAKDHWDGFEKERMFHEILGDMDRKGICLQAKHLRRIIELVNSEFLKGLFDRRPCARTLRYKGWCSSEEELAGESDKKFSVGLIYESTDFNGGTYTIKDYRKVIGVGYFEMVN